jgi:hypothetical protein
MCHGAMEAGHECKGTGWAMGWGRHGSVGGWVGAVNHYLMVTSRGQDSVSSGSTTAIAGSMKSDRRLTFTACSSDASTEFLVTSAPVPVGTKETDDDLTCPAGTEGDREAVGATTLTPEQQCSGPLTVSQRPSPPSPPHPPPSPCVRAMEARTHGAVKGRKQNRGGGYPTSVAH